MKKYIFTIAIMNFIIYLGFAFITLKINPFEWGRTNREIFILIICATNFILLIIDFLSDDYVIYKRDDDDE